MKILIVDEPASARALAIMLGPAGHELVLAHDCASANGLLESRSFDAVLCEWLLPDFEGTNVIRRVRAKSGPRPLLFLMSSMPEAKLRSFAQKWGADDFLAKPLSATVLSNAVLVSGARRLTPTPANLGLPAKAQSAPQLASTQAWSQLGDRVAAVVRECAGASFTAEAADKKLEVAVSATMSMADVANLTELSVSLFASTQSARALAALMVQESNPDEDLLRDVLNELCNTLLGALKTAWRREGHMFSLSLPAKRALSVNDMTEKYGTLRTFSLRAAGITLGVAIGTRTMVVDPVQTRRLRENMLVLDDVKSEAGVLLLAAGTRLTETTAERIMTHLPKGTVRVCSLEAGAV